MTWFLSSAARSADFSAFCRFFVAKNDEVRFADFCCQIADFFNSLRRHLKTVMSNFLKKDLLKFEVHLIDYKNKINFLNTSNVYLGLYAGKLITTELTNDEIEEIVKNCIDFYIELCDQLFKRFDFADQLKCLKGINPNALVNGELNSIFEIVKQFPNLICEADMQTIDSEFRELNLLDLQDLINKNNNLLDFWKNICEIKSFDSKTLFPKLCIFI